MCGESNGYPISDKAIEGLNRLVAELGEMESGFPTNMIMNLSTGQSAEVDVLSNRCYLGEGRGF